MIVEQENRSKQNKIEKLTTRNNYIFERAENFKCIGVILNVDNVQQTDLQEKIKSADKTHFKLQTIFSNKNIYI